MWVTSGSYVGHIRNVLWVSGSNGSQVRPTFNPVNVYLSASCKTAPIASYISHDHMHEYYCRYLVVIIMLPIMILMSQHEYYAV